MSEHFKEVFPPKIEAQLLEIDDTDTTIGKMTVLMLLFKPEYCSPQVFMCWHL